MSDMDGNLIDPALLALPPPPTRKRKASIDDAPPTKRKRPNNVDITNIQAIVQKQNILRKMGVLPKYYLLLGKRLDDMTEAEKARLLSIRLDLWLQLEAVEFRYGVAEFWFIHHDPIYITDMNNHAVPYWWQLDKTWYKLWWQNSPFTIPGEIQVWAPRNSQLSPDQQAVAWWVSNAFQPGRVGRPKQIIIEILIEWNMWPDTMGLSIPQPNLAALVWIFDLLGGDRSRLCIKVLLKNSSIPGFGPDSKRSLPPPLKGLETSILNSIDQLLVHWKQFIDREPTPFGIGYEIAMTPTEAADSTIPVADKERDVQHVFAHFINNIFVEMFDNQLRLGYIKLIMFQAFGFRQIDIERDRDVGRYLEYPQWAKLDFGIINGNVESDS